MIRLCIGPTICRGDLEVGDENARSMDAGFYWNP